MWHSTARSPKSLVDAMTDLRASATAPEQSGVTRIRATLPMLEPKTGEVIDVIEHSWLRESYETERDFVAQALAAARELGIRAVRAEALIEVPE